MCCFLLDLGCIPDEPGHQSTNSFQLQGPLLGAQIKGLDTTLQAALLPVVSTLLEGCSCDKISSTGLELLPVLVPVIWVLLVTPSNSIHPFRIG